MSNTLIAITNLIKYIQGKGLAIHAAAKENESNRIQAVGSSLEIFVKDLYAGFPEKPGSEIAYRDIFSWQGSKNNPPDLMLRGGDAIEIKKIQSLVSSLALNSSYPKQRLLKNNPFLSSGCKACEEWESKDIVYIIGSVINGNLKQIWFVYGDCYFANIETYATLKRKITNDIRKIKGYGFSDTNELGRINNIDPRKITNLRIRGMYEVVHPSIGFSYLGCVDRNRSFQMHCIMTAEKYNGYSDYDKKTIEMLVNENFSIKDVDIFDPNDATSIVEKNLKAKLISFNLL